MTDESQRTLAELLRSVVSQGAEPSEGTAGESGVLPGVTVPPPTPPEGREYGAPTVVLDTGIESSLSQLNSQLAALTRAALEQAESAEANTRAVLESAASSSGSGSGAGNVARTVLSVLGGGLGLVSLVGRLFGGGGKEEAPEPLVRTLLPPSINIEAGVSQAASGLLPVRQTVDGLPRAVTQPAAATPITIQVQAIDSRSFMDHSAEIAQAVKDALLTSHSLGDVVQEL